MLQPALELLSCPFSFARKEAPGINFGRTLVGLYIYIFNWVRKHESETLLCNVSKCACDT